MSIEFCTACERVTEGETLSDENGDLICPFCLEVTVIEMNQLQAQQEQWWISLDADEDWINERCKDA